MSDDPLALHQLYARYGALIDAGRFDDWLGLFAAQCTYHIVPRENWERALAATAWLRNRACDLARFWSSAGRFAGERDPRPLAAVHTAGWFLTVSAGKRGRGRTRVRRFAGEVFARRSAPFRPFGRVIKGTYLVCIP